LDVSRDVVDTENMSVYDMIGDQAFKRRVANTVIAEDLIDTASIMKK